MFYPLINNKTTLQKKSSLLLYTLIICPTIFYACPVWASPNKIEKISNSPLQISVNFSQGTTVCVYQTTS